MSSPKRPVLGRGLSALIPDLPSQAPIDAPSAEPTRLNLSQIRAASHQPRVRFDDERLAELAASIKEHGLLQPLVVRPAPDGTYSLIAGERRFRASRLAGLETVPVVIHQATDTVAFELALIENIQREDLDPIEEAEAYQHLLVSNGLTQEQVAQRVGKDRTTVANALRLLKLPTSIRSLVAQGTLSSGHARALLSLSDQDAMAEVAERVVTQGASVRETERICRDLKAPPPPPPKEPSLPSEEPQAEAAPEPKPRPSHADAALEAQLRTALSAPVSLVQKGGRGRIEIRFHSLDELERLVELLTSLDDR